MFLLRPRMVISTSYWDMNTVNAPVINGSFLFINGFNLAFSMYILTRSEGSLFIYKFYLAML